MTRNNADTTQPHRRCRRCSRSALWLFALLLALIATGCGATTATAQDQRAAQADAAPGQAEPTVPQPTAANAESDENTPVPTGSAESTDSATPTPAVTPTPHPVAAADTELPAAPIGFENLFDTAPSGPKPLSIEIENINVREADIIPVGVNDDLTFEVPPADQVGWYEFGSAPGEAGSAVLAAHIAFNGVDGVFRYLENVEIGSVVVIGFDDGSRQRYRIEEVTEYVKEALPDSLFARDGREQLALITCGGTFNYQLDSYESNTVAIAVPI